MKSVLRITAGGLVAGLVCMLGASSAIAHDQNSVNWSINVGAPYYPAAVYRAPREIVVQQPITYIERVERAPVVHYRSNNPQEYSQGYSRAYYVEEVRRPHWRWKHHHRHHHNDN